VTRARSLLITRRANELLKAMQVGKRGGETKNEVRTKGKKEVSRLHIECEEAMGAEDCREVNKHILCPA